MLIYKKTFLLRRHFTLLAIISLMASSWQITSKNLTSYQRRKPIDHHLEGSSKSPMTSEEKVKKIKINQSRALKGMGLCLRYPKTSFAFLSVSFLYIWELIFNNEKDLHLLGLYEEELPWNKEDMGYQKKIGIVSTCTRRSEMFDPKNNIHNYGEEVEAASYQNKKDYCKHNKEEVDCLISILKPNSMDNIFAYKIQLMLYFIDYYEFLAWVDCDTIFRDYSKSFKGIITNDHDLWIGKDKPHMINAGVYVIRTSKMKGFLKRVLRIQRYFHYPAKPFLRNEDKGISDQYAMVVALVLSPFTRVNYVDIKKFNSYPAYMGPPRKDFVGGDAEKRFIVHHITALRQASDSYRKRFIEQAYCSEIAEYSFNTHQKEVEKVKLCTVLYENPTDIQIVNTTNWNQLLKHIKNMNGTQQNGYYVDLSMKLNPITLWLIKQEKYVYTLSGQTSHYELVRRSAIINGRKKFLHIEFMDLWDSRMMDKNVYSIPVDQQWFVIFKRSKTNKRIIESIYSGGKSEEDKGFMQYLYLSNTKHYEKEKFFDRKKGLACVQKYCVYNTIHPTAERALFRGKLAQFF